ncbi:MAG: hypothetical protein GF355_04570, partial [Candidatus Eisenbacteria bacterium]|nr:hypothetical protein [Candidatus Eisenbacteria bacterium]
MIRGSSHKGRGVIARGMLLACLLAGTGPAAPAAEYEVPRRPADSDLQIHQFLYEAMEMEAQGSVSNAELQAWLRARGARLDDLGRVHMEVIGAEGAPAVSAASLAPYGAELENSWRHRADVWVPLVEIVDLARSLAPDYVLRKAKYGQPDDVMGEGPAVTNSETYRNGGADGNGLTIAVFDSGYDNLTEAMNNGDAPPPEQTTRINLTSYDFEDPADGSHG